MSLDEPVKLLCIAASKFPSQGVIPRIYLEVMQYI